MFYRNATEIRVASLEKRLARLERKAGFFTPVTDLFANAQDLVKEEILHMMPGIKAGPHNNFFVTLPIDSEVIIEKAHTWQLILNIEEAKGRIESLQILVSPFKDASTNFLRQLDSNERKNFVWEQKYIQEDRKEIKDALKNFVVWFKKNIHPMIGWSVVNGVLTRDQSAWEHEQGRLKHYFDR